MEKTKVITREVVFTEIHLDEHRAGDKYAVGMLISKDDYATVGRIREACRVALDADESDKLPIIDGREVGEDPETFFLFAESDQKPGIIGQDNNIVDPADIAPGCAGRASLYFYAQTENGETSIKAGLNNLQIFTGTPHDQGKSKEWAFTGAPKKQDITTKWAYCPKAHIISKKYNLSGAWGSHTPQEIEGVTGGDHCYHCKRNQFCDIWEGMIQANYFRR